MPLESRQVILQNATNRFAVHHCPYLERLRRAGGDERVETYRIAQLATELIALHAPHGTCPPTHENHNPTKSWSEWIKDTQV